MKRNYSRRCEAESGFEILYLYIWKRAIIDDTFEIHRIIKEVLMKKGIKLIEIMKFLKSQEKRIENIVRDQVKKEMEFFPVNKDLKKRVLKAISSKIIKDFRR